MPKFSFNQFRHDTRRWTKNGLPVESHTLELSGPDEESGEINRAILIFDSGEELYHSRREGTVGYITRKPDGGTSLVGWLPLDDLDDYLEILEAGDALSVHFTLRDPRAQVGYVRQLGLGQYEKITNATICRTVLDDPRGFSNVVRFPI